MIKFKDISKSFWVKEKKKKTIKHALANISFAINKGETVGLIGANGSGKSTLIKVLSSLYVPEQGEVLIDGVSALTNPQITKKAIGVLFGGDAGLYGNLTAYENIEYFGRLAGLDDQTIKKRSEQFLAFFNMDGYIKQRVANFSRGMRQKVCFLRAVIHNPKIIILDEPSTGLDVQGIQEVASFIKLNQRSNKTIIISSHNMNEISNLCQKIIILRGGQLAFFGDLGPLLTQGNGFTKIYELMGVKA